MGNSCTLWAHTRFQRRAMPKVIKNRAIHLRIVCWVSVLTTFSAPPQILAASTVFFCPIPETKKWWWWFWCYCRFVSNSKRLLSTSCIARASAVASSIFFMVLFDVFWSSQNRMCRKTKQTLNNELKFHIVNIYYCMSGAMNRHCIRINYVQ